MGLATIISHVGEGLYRVRPEYDWSKLEAELAKLDREDEDNEKLRQQLLLDIADQIVVVAQKEGALNEAIQIDKVQPSGETEPGRMVGGITSEDGTVLVDSVKIPDLPTVSSAVMDATVALAIERKILEALKLRRSEVEAGYITRQKRRNTLNSARDKINDSEIQAWCVDYSTEIAPDTKVRTIEVPGYRLKGEPSMVIAPGGSGTSGVKYGQLRSALTMTPETVFLNAALEPGHLKWRPRWRYGQITWISESEDKCHVALEQEWGRRVDVAPKMPLNEADALENVPIRYMSCNRAAFEVGDWVVVEWKNGEPAVVGFRREPKSCIGDFWGDSAAGRLMFYGSGTYRETPVLAGGSGSWVGEAGEVISWSGGTAYQGGVAVMNWSLTLLCAALVTMPDGSRWIQFLTAGGVVVLAPGKGDARSLQSLPSGRSGASNCHFSPSGNRVFYSTAGITGSSVSTPGRLWEATITRSMDESGQPQISMSAWSLVEEQDCRVEYEVLRAHQAEEWEPGPNIFFDCSDGETTSLIAPVGGLYRAYGKVLLSAYYDGETLHPIFVEVEEIDTRNNYSASGERIYSGWLLAGGSIQPFIHIEETTATIDREEVATLRILDGTAEIASAEVYRRVDSGTVYRHATKNFAPRGNGCYDPEEFEPDTIVESDSRIFYEVKHACGVDIGRHGARWSYIKLGSRIDTTTHSASSAPSTETEYENTIEAVSPSATVSLKYEDRFRITDATYYTTNSKQNRVANALYRATTVALSGLRAARKGDVEFIAASRDEKTVAAVGGKTFALDQYINAVSNISEAVALG